MLFQKEGDINMFRISLLSVIFYLSIISISAQTASEKTSVQKRKKATQDSLKSVSSDTTGQSTQQKWIKGVLGRVEKEKTMDSISAAHKDTTISPYEIMKAQKKNAIPLLIIRPVSVFGVSTLKNKWLLLLCEAYIHFRLGAIPVLSIVARETLSDQLPYYDEYNNAISLERYKEAAKDLSVPYLLYLQCSYTKFTREVTFLGDITSVDNDRSIVTLSKTFPLRTLGLELDQFTKQIVKKMGIVPSQELRFFLDTPLMSKEAKNLKTLGEFLASVDKLDDASWDEFLKNYKDFLKQDSQMIVGIYAASKFCGAAEKYKQAAGFSHVLINKLGHKYPPAYLLTAKYYRLAGNYEQALRVVDRASNINEIQKQLKEEKARIEKEAREAEKNAKNRKAKK